MKINNLELEDIDIFDVEVAEKYERILENVEKAKVELDGYADSSISAVIRFQCNVIFKVFNDLFGEGTDKKVFGEKVNLKTCMLAFEELVIKINEQKGEIEKITSKYAPNRAQRRTKK